MRVGFNYRPRNIFFFSIILFAAFLALQPVLGDGAITAGIDIAAFIFLIWSVVAGIREAARTAKAKKSGTLNADRPS